MDNACDVAVYDVIVVGGGVIGLSIISQLAEKEKGSYALYEKGLIGWGATYKSAALVRTHYTEEIAVRVAVRSLEFFKKKKVETGFNQVGFMVGVGSKDADTLREVTRMMRNAGSNVRYSSNPSELESVDRFIDHKIYAAFAFEEEAGYADPIKTVNYFRRTAEANGVEIFPRRSVDKLVVDGGSITGVKVDGDLVRADRVVIAAGAWSVDLARGVGDELPIRPRRSPVLLTRGPSGFGRDHPAFYDMVSGVYGRPYADDVLLAGPGLLAGAASATGQLKRVVNNMMKPQGGYKLTPDSYNGSLFPDEAEFIYQAVSKTFPALKEGYPMFGWAGIIDDCSDGYEILGESLTTDGLFYAVGFSGHGFKEAPAVGEYICDKVLDRKPELDLSVYSLGRFKEGRPIVPGYTYLGGA